MIFSHFFKGKGSGSKPLEQFAYFETETELAGVAALPLKEQLETQITTLKAKAKLTEPEQSELAQLEAQLQQLLKSGQIEQALLIDKSAAPNPDSNYSDWLTPAQQAVSLLVVEDDPELLSLLEFFLKPWASSLQIFHDGATALEWLKNNPPVDLVSLDLMLPRVDGLSLLQWIRQSPEWSEVPVLIVSSKSDQPTVQKALELGASDFIYKPLQPDTYLAKIKQQLRRSA